MWSYIKIPSSATDYSLAFSFATLSISCPLKVTNKKLISFTKGGGLEVAVLIGPNTSNGEVKEWVSETERESEEREREREEKANIRAKLPYDSWL